MQKILFVCSQNRLRSPTAEQVFSMDSALEVRSAGLDPAAVNPLSSDDLQWADIIFVMEKSHRSKITNQYKEFIRGKRLICLNIPDVYNFMDPELIRRLKASVPRYLNRK